MPAVRSGTAENTVECQFYMWSLRGRAGHLAALFLFGGRWGDGLPNVRRLFRQGGF